MTLPTNDENLVFKNLPRERPCIKGVYMPKQSTVILSPVHTSNNVEATGNNKVASCFDIVAGVDRALVTTASRTTGLNYWQLRQLIVATGSTLFSSMHAVSI